MYHKNYMLDIQFGSPLYYYYNFFVLVDTWGTATVDRNTKTPVPQLTGHLRPETGFMTNLSVACVNGPGCKFK